MKEMGKRSCYLCNCVEYEVVYHYSDPDKYLVEMVRALDKFEREWRVCLQCGLVYNVHSHGGVENIYKRYWTKELEGVHARELFHKIKSLPPEESENYSRVVWLRNGLKELAKRYSILQRHPKKVLDIGCGLGIFLDRFCNSEWEGYGVEPSPFGCKIVEEEVGVPVVCGYYQPSVFMKKFDLITLIHVLEHIADPIQFLINVREDLLPDSVLFIEVPEVMELAHSSKDCEACGSEHFFLFSPSSLITMVERAGYTPIMLDREVSCRPRRRIKLLAIMDEAKNTRINSFYSNAEKVLKYRDGYLQKSKAT